MLQQLSTDPTNDQEDPEHQADPHVATQALETFVAMLTYCFASIPSALNPLTGSMPWAGMALTGLGVQTTVKFVAKLAEQG